MREFAFLALVGVFALVVWRYDADGASTSVADADVTAIDRGSTHATRSASGVGDGESEGATLSDDSDADGTPEGDASDDSDADGGAERRAPERVDALDLAAPFEIRWADPENRTVRVADDAYSAVFDVVDRGGGVVVEPADGAFRRGEAPPEWFATAAETLEDALPDRVDAFADTATGWLDDEDLLTASDVESFDCEHVRDIDRGRVVAVAADDKRAELIVDHGSATFTSTIDRNRYPDWWARRARLAAEVHVQRHLVDGDANGNDGATGES